FHGSLEGTWDKHGNAWPNHPSFMAQPKDAVRDILSMNPQVVAWVSGHLHLGVYNESCRQPELYTYDVNQVQNIHNPALLGTGYMYGKSRNGGPKVPCHNDPLCENWVEGDGRMYLIDWEYAGMNDGMWDIADVSIEAGFDDQRDELLLTAYLGREPGLVDRKHFLASKIYVDYLWTLWAKARVPYDGQPMEDWAQERYARLKGFLDKYAQL
ncbi:MAG: phosphotransferase, partial [Clostridia bacterium]|nr:phosphotransferase [Clostridia bacterium]